MAQSPFLFQHNGFWLVAFQQQAMNTLKNYKRFGLGEVAGRVTVTRNFRAVVDRNVGWSGLRQIYRNRVVRVLGIFEGEDATAFHLWSKAKVGYQSFDFFS